LEKLYIISNDGRWAADHNGSISAIEQNSYNLRRMF